MPFAAAELSFHQDLICKLASRPLLEEVIQLDRLSKAMSMTARPSHASPSPATSSNSVELVRLEMPQEPPILM